MQLTGLETPQKLEPDLYVRIVGVENLHGEIQILTGGEGSMKPKRLVTTTDSTIIEYKQNVLYAYPTNLLTLCHPAMN